VFAQKSADHRDIEGFMHDAPKVTQPKPPNGEPAQDSSSPELTGAPRLQVSVQFGPTRSIPGSRLKKPLGK